MKVKGSTYMQRNAYKNKSKIEYTIVFALGESVFFVGGCNVLHCHPDFDWKLVDLVE